MLTTIKAFKQYSQQKQTTFQFLLLLKERTFILLTRQNIWVCISIPSWIGSNILQLYAYCCLNRKYRSAINDKKSQKDFGSWHLSLCTNSLCISSIVFSIKSVMRWIWSIVDLCLWKSNWWVGKSILTEIISISRFKSSFSRNWDKIGSNDIGLYEATNDEGLPVTSNQVPFYTLLSEGILVLSIRL